MIAPGVYDFDFPSVSRLKGFKVVNHIDSSHGFYTQVSFKKYYDDPQPTKMVWHHIVEQRLANGSNVPGQQLFSREQINNIRNEIYIDQKLNSLINDFYSSVRAESNGQVFRYWLGRQDYDTQHKWGVRIMRSIAIQNGYKINYK